MSENSKEARIEAEAQMRLALIHTRQQEQLATALETMMKIR